MQTKYIKKTLEGTCYVSDIKKEGYIQYPLKQKLNNVYYNINFEPVEIYDDNDILYKITLKRLMFSHDKEYMKKYEDSKEKTMNAHLSYIMSHKSETQEYIQKIYRDNLQYYNEDSWTITGMFDAVNEIYERYIETP